MAPGGCGFCAAAPRAARWRAAALRILHADRAHVRRSSPCDRAGRPRAWFITYDGIVSLSSAVGGVSGAFESVRVTAVMNLDACGRITGESRVERSVNAPNHVHEVHDVDCTRLRAAAALDTTIRLREGPAEAGRRLSFTWFRDAEADRHCPRSMLLSGLDSTASAAAHASTLRSATHTVRSKRGRRECGRVCTSPPSLRCAL